MGADRISDYRKTLVPAHSLLRALMDFSQEVSQEFERDPTCGLDDIGLLFWEEIYYYESTPKNAIPFAVTGGDGVHYSLLVRQGICVTDWPVVMTVPVGAGKLENWVMGENLLDFLNLGCHTGYFGLEGLAYEDDRSEVVAHFGIVDDQLDHWPEKLDLLKRLRAKFELDRWSNVEKKIYDLQSRFHHCLDVIPFDQRGQ
jgi:hypothetical protein